MRKWPNDSPIIWWEQLEREKGKGKREKGKGKRQNADGTDLAEHPITYPVVLGDTEPLRTLNIYVPPAYTRSEESPRGRK